MRSIITHCTNELNEKIIIKVLDEPGPGGACHHYEISGVGPTIDIRFQKGAIREAGINGISNEALLAIVLDRLASFQAGPFACRENADALLATNAALDRLMSRTRARIKQGVEGVSEQHKSE
jgi:hypothetical protein